MHKKVSKCFPESLLVGIKLLIPMDLWLLPSAQAFGAEDSVSELKKADEYLSGIISTKIMLLNFTTMKCNIRIENNYQVDCTVSWWRISLVWKLWIAFYYLYWWSKARPLKRFYLPSETILCCRNCFWLKSWNFDCPIKLNIRILMFLLWDCSSDGRLMRIWRSVTLW